MKLPSFDDFKKSPMAAIAFISLVVIGYLYIDLKSAQSTLVESHKQQFTEYVVNCARREESQNKEIRALREDLAKLQDKFLKMIEISSKK